MSCVTTFPPAAMQTASVPQTPATRCAGTAPTTSSSFIVSITLMPPVHRTAPDRADDDRPVVIDDIGSRRDRDEAGDGSVQSRQQVDSSQEGPRHRDGRDHSGRRREVGVGEHVAHGDGVRRAAQRELRPAVEAEPPEPQDEHAERHHRDVRRRRGLDRCRRAGTSRVSPPPPWRRRARPSRRWSARSSSRRSPGSPSR